MSTIMRTNSAFNIQADDLLRTVQKEAEFKRDFTEKGNNIILGLNDDKIVLRRKSHAGKSGLYMSDFALTQLLNRYKIEVPDTKNALKSDDERRKRLMVEYINTFLETDDTELLIRSKIDGNFGKVRAVLSENYTTLNNIDIVKSFIKEVNDNKLDVSIQNKYSDDDGGYFTFRAILNGSAQRFGKESNVADIVKSGLDFVNSETGRKSFMIEPMIFRLICTNGLKAWRKNGNITKQRHAYIGEGELNNLVIRGIGEGIKESKNILEHMEQSKLQFNPNPIGTIKIVCENQNISQKLTKEVIKAYMEEPMKSNYGVINAFTRAARYQKNERQHEIEMLAGRLLTDKSILVRAK